MQGEKPHPQLPHGRQRSGRQADTGQSSRRDRRRGCHRWLWGSRSHQTTALGQNRGRWLVEALGGSGSRPAGSGLRPALGGGGAPGQQVRQRAPRSAWMRVSSPGAAPADWEGRERKQQRRRPSRSLSASQPREERSDRRVGMSESRSPARTARYRRLIHFEVTCRQARVLRRGSARRRGSNWWGGLPLV